MPSPNNPNISEQISPDGNPLPPAAPVVDKPVVAPAAPKETVEPIAPAAKEVVADDEKPVDFTQFLEAKSVVTLPEKKVEEKKLEEKPLEVKVTPQVSSDGRDYSEFNPEEQVLFKRMSNDAFNKLKPIYLEHRRLKTEKEELTKQLEEAKKGVVKVPDTYYEHPNAFLLTPEYASTVERVYQAEAIFNHWSDQLNKVREGAKEVEMLGTDAQGNLAITHKVPADVGAETMLLKHFNFAQQQLMNEQASQKAIVSSHNERFKNSTEFLRNFEKESFPLFETEEGRKMYDPLINDTINKFPAAFRKSPLSPILAKSLVTTLQLAMLVKKLQDKAPTPPNPAARIGPSIGEAAGEGGDNNGKKDISFDDFERAKQGV